MSFRIQHESRKILSSSFSVFHCESLNAGRVGSPSGTYCLRSGLTLQSVAASADLSTLTNGTLQQFEGSLAVLLERLKPVSEYAKRFTLYFDANAHNAMNTP